MPVSYDSNYFRAGAGQRRFLMSGDHDMALGHYGMELADDAFHDPLVDSALARLLAALGRKGWDVPGIHVTFDVTHTDDAPVHHVYRVTGGRGPDYWSVRFTRAQYRDPNHLVPVHIAPSYIDIPRLELHLYDDGDASFFPYAGRDWDADADAFYAAMKPGQRAMRGTRLYVAYERRGNIYAHTTHHGSEPVLSGRESSAHDVHYIHNKVARFFNTVTQDLLSLPDHADGPHTAWMRFAHIAPIPVANSMPVLYVTHQYRHNDDSDSGVVLPRGGKRLCDLSFEHNTRFPVPKIATDGFRYGFAHTPSESRSGFWGDDPLDQDTRVARVRLKWANDIYIVDESPLLALYDNYRDIALKKGSIRLDPDHEKHMVAAVARTITPLASYGGGFENPMYLINRPLWADEATDVTDTVRTPIAHQNGKIRYALNPV